MKCMPSFIEIGGAVSEKNDHIRQTFVVLYIRWHIEEIKINSQHIIAKTPSQNLDKSAFYSVEK